MTGEKPIRDPVDLFISRMRATEKSFAVLAKHEWLGQFENLTSEFDQLHETVKALRSYGRQYVNTLADIDAKLIDNNPATSEPLITKRKKLQVDASAHFEREAPRLARALNHFAELATAEYGVELEKREHGGDLPETEARTARHELRQGLAETDEFSELTKIKKDSFMRQLNKWDDYVSEYEDRIYMMFQPESSVMFRMPKVPQEYQKPLALLMAVDFMETVSEHAMQTASDLRGSGRAGSQGVGT